MSRAALLVLGWGNRSRGDDALGPLFIDRLQAWAASSRLAAGVDFIEEYQLQPEHALDLHGRQHVLFVDASLDCAAPCELRTLAARRDRSITSHALTPESVLQVFVDLEDVRLPECCLLTIRGDSFELGAAPGEAAARNLEFAVESGRRWLLDRAAASAATSEIAELD